MARIPPEELERLKAEVSVEHLVAASGVDLKAAGKDLLSHMRWVHLDKDDVSDAALAAIRNYRLPPTLIVASGGGYNAYWQLTQPIPVNGDTRPLVAANQLVVDELGRHT